MSVIVGRRITNAGTYLPKCLLYFDKENRIHYLSRNMENPALLIAKSNVQISCAVTKQLIGIFVLVTWIVQALFFLTTEKSSLKPSSLVVHPGLCRILLEIPKRGFHPTSSLKPSSLVVHPGLCRILLEILKRGFHPTWSNTEKVALFYFMVMFVK